MPDEDEEEASEHVGQTLRCGPQGIVSTRYLATSATASDSHVHVFRETTV